MTVQLHTTKNNSVGTVQNNPLTNSGTNLIVNNGLDTKLQTLGFPFWLTMWAAGLTPDTDSNLEIVNVTARVSPNNYTITRGQQGTTGVQHNQNDNVGLLWTAGNAQEVITTDAVGKGYIFVFDASGVPHALPVGSNTQVLTANSAATYGIDWETLSTVSSAQVQAETFTYFADTGAANAYVITPSPVIGSYVAGQRFQFKAANTNTGASTLNINGLGANSIVKAQNQPLSYGDILANQIIDVIFDGGSFQMVSANNTSPWVKISTIAFSAVSVPTATVTNLADFTGLTGNTDDVYMLIWEITASGANSSTRGLGIRYNADTGNNYIGVEATLGSTYSGNSTSAQSYSPIISGVALAGSFGDIMIYAKNVGNNRGAIYRAQNGNNPLETGNSTWVNSSNQITEITITIIQASGSTQTYSGSVTLYRINR